MADKIQGKDNNGMRPAPWPKLDVSAIEKIKVSDKASNSEIASAIQKMISEAVLLLYGNNTDKKYVKLVDLIMLRIRGALEKLDKQASQQNSTVNDQILSSIQDSIKELIDKDHKSRKTELKSVVDQILEKIDEINDRVKDIEDISFKDDDVDFSDSKKKSASTTHISNENPSNDEIDSLSTGKTSTSIADILQKQESTYSFLVQLQADVTSSFQKIENLITSNSTQKAVEQAVPSSLSPVDQKITGQNKKTEDKVNGQLGKIDENTFGEVDKEDLKAKAKKEKEQEKTDDKADKKREKQLKKNKKSAVKNILTGKQFDKLTQLLNKQFFYVTDYSELMMKKITKQFTKINKRLDTLIKDRNAHGFSWTKFLLFASLFLLPMFWDKIMDLLKYLDETFKINEKIDEWINNIDWVSHIAKIGAFLWDAVVKVFNKFIKDPFGWIIEKVKTTYDMLVDWVKDVWHYVTGEVNKGKKIDKEQQKKQKKEEGILQATIREYRSTVAKREKAELAAIERAGKDKASKIDNEINSINKHVKDSSVQINDTIDRSFQNSNQELERTLEKVTPDTERILTENQAKLEEQTAKTVDESVKIIRDNAKTIKEQIEADGSPTGISKIDLAKFEEEANDMNHASVSLDKAVEQAEKSLGTYQGIEHFTKIADNKGNAAITTKDAMGNLEQLQQLQNESMAGGSTAKKISNARSYGVWSAASAQNFVGQDEKRRDAAIESQLSDSEKKKAVVQYVENKNGVNTEALLFENTVKALDLVSDTYKGIDESLLSSAGLLEDVKVQLSSYWTSFNKFIAVTHNKAMNGQNAQTTNNNIFIMNGNSSRNNLMNANMS